MLKTFILFSVFLAMRVSASTGPDPRFKTWAQAKSPTSNPVKIHGGYAKGCIEGAVELPKKSSDYTVVNLEDNRNYGHPETIRFIQDLAGHLRKKGLPPILIEDISPPRGGPVLKGHASHQNGLDIDISFLIPEKPLSLQARQKRPEISFVEADKKTLKAIWGDYQTQLLVTTASSNRINRVFVAPAIKKYVCEKYPEAPWLYKVRAWWGHEDHLHARLHCPVTEKGCVPQPLDEGDMQCGSTLEKWLKRVAPPPPKPPAPPLKDEKKVEPAKIKYKTFPKLPEECKKVIEGE